MTVCYNVETKYREVIYGNSKEAKRKHRII